MLRVSDDLWLISDTHFGHANIVRYCDRPEDHEKQMLDNWKSLVKPGDQILHLGDLVFWKNPESWVEIVSLLPGEKFLVKGNHDRLSKLKGSGFTIIDPFITSSMAFTHRPISTMFPAPTREPWSINLHGHIHNNNHRAEGETFADKRYVNLSVEVIDYKPVRLSEALA